MSSEVVDRSDLLDWANHEHEHLSKLFDDLRATFNEMAQGELDEEAMQEASGQALEDLDVALEDMLEHFNEEEEVYFLAIEQRFPEYSESIEALVRTHESICAKIQRLQRHLVEDREALAGELSAKLVALVNSLALEVERHNIQEQEVFTSALKRLSTDEQIALMARKQSLG